MDEKAGEEKDARYVKWNTRCLARQWKQVRSRRGVLCGCGNRRSLTDGNGLLRWWGWWRALVITDKSAMVVVKSSALKEGEGTTRGNVMMRKQNKAADGSVFLFSLVVFWRIIWTVTGFFFFCLFKVRLSVVVLLLITSHHSRHWFSLFLLFIMFRLVFLFAASAKNLISFF